ncbi:MAG: hypothetical protein Rubg2KO_06300 [Rubricoccaceae bacterium]
MTRALSPLILCLALVVPASAQEVSRTLDVEGRSRIALVIGNSDYEHAAPLQNPRNDAEDIAAALTEVGFEVSARIDLSHEEMGLALAQFKEAAVGAEAALFYYAGHGVQVDGDNFLIPVNADVSSEDLMRYRSIGLGEVMEALDASGALLKMVFLDACRDNPFQSWRSSSAGLAQTDSPLGSLVVYAAAPGRRASDNQQGRNGLFTAALLEEIHTPGLELDRMVRRVQARVIAASSERQHPWKSSSYVNDFYFVPPVEDSADAQPPSSGTIAPDAQTTSVPEPEDLRIRATSLDAQINGAPHPDSILVSPAARRVWTDAAEGGHPEAQSVVGWLGLMSGAPDADAIRQLEAAAAQGHPAAQTNLAYAYATGLGVDRDYTEAARLYALAADQNRAVAQNGLGILYETGRGVEQDSTEAAMLYGLAAVQGLPEARINLAQLLEATAPWRAADMYEEAALDGDVVAMSRLASLYERGVGVPQSHTLAKQWRERAAVLGEPHALAWFAAQANAAIEADTIPDPDSAQPEETTGTSNNN